MLDAQGRPEIKTLEERVAALEKFILEGASSQWIVPKFRIRADGLESVIKDTVKNQLSFSLGAHGSINIDEN